MDNQNMTPEQQAQASMDMIKGVYEDGIAEINGREYKFTKMVHKERRKVFAFFTSVQAQLQAQSLWFLESPEFEAVEAIIQSRVLFNDQMLSKLGNHWDLYPQDYVLFIQTALGVISYPFLPASSTGSQSQEDQPQPTTLKKPMLT